MGIIEKIDFNGLGSSNIHHNDNIFISIGAPEAYNDQIANFAQNKNSMYLKIIEISNVELEKINFNQLDTLNPKIFGGILADRENTHHLEALKTMETEAIDLIIVNLSKSSSTGYLRVGVLYCLINFTFLFLKIGELL